LSAAFPEFHLPNALTLRPIDILALGSAVLEQVIQVDRWPASGGQGAVTISRMTFTAGGCGINVSCFSGRLGACSAVICCLGDGKYSQEIWDELGRSNVLTQYIHRFEGHDGNLVIELTNPEGDWTVMNYMDPEVKLSVADIPLEDVFRSTKILHIDGYSYVNAGDRASVETAFARARQAGCVISVDGCVPAAENHPDFMASLFARADIVFANLYEAFSATKTSSVEEAMQIFQKMGPKLCILKMGLDGSHMITPEGFGHVPAYPVDVVDTVAAGDAYIATCLSRLIQGDSLLRAARRGSAAGALACLGPGSLSSRFGLADIDRLINDYEDSIAAI
jgi:sugar/nucleoside kinase (ribokinase family)